MTKLWEKERKKENKCGCNYTHSQVLSPVSCAIHIFVVQFSVRLLHNYFRSSRMSSFSHSGAGMGWAY